MVLVVSRSVGRLNVLRLVGLSASWTTSRLAPTIIDTSACLSVGCRNEQQSAHAHSSILAALLILPTSRPSSILFNYFIYLGLHESPSFITMGCLCVVSRLAFSSREPSLYVSLAWPADRTMRRADDESVIMLRTARL